MDFTRPPICLLHPIPVQRLRVAVDRRAAPRFFGARVAVGATGGDVARSPAAQNATICATQSASLGTAPGPRRSFAIRATSSPWR